MATLSLPPIRSLPIRDFSGGLNLRDAQGELAVNEAPDAWNVTLDERGGVTKRLGYAKYNGVAFNASRVVNVYYWPSGQNLITQSGTGLFKDTSTTAFKTFTTAARAAFADFQGRLYFTHPVDGLFYYDGTTVTAVPTGPKGSTLAAWQNKLWSNDATTNARVIFSAAGDGTSWPGTSFNDLREKDTEPIVCLAGASGIDIAGRPGLLAFKRRSTYRIYDSSTAAYATIDSAVGTASALSVVTRFARTISLSESGIYWTDGIGALRPASEREEPLWTPQQVAFDQLDLWCAGWRGDRVFFSLARAGATTNNLALEYHPLQGWLVPASNAASSYATYGKNDQKLLAGSPTVNGQVYQQLTGGTDDGAAIASWFQTRWFEPNDGFLTRMRHLRVTGRGSFTLYKRTDYDLGNGEMYAVSITGAPSIYDDPAAIYDAAGVVYGPVKSQDYQTFHSLGTCRAISFRVEETSSTSSTGPQILSSGTAPEIGAWSLYGLDLQHVQLGLA